MGKNIFILHTMHHINLAISLIKKYEFKDNILLLFDTFKINDREINIISRYFKIIKIFDKYSNEKFQSKQSIPEWYKKVVFNYNQSNRFDKFLKELIRYEFENIFFGNNTGIEVQILINRLKNNLCKVMYIEDGSAAYHDVKYEEKNFKIKKFLKPNYLVYNIKYSYFRKFTNNSAIGVAEYVNGGYYLKKDCVREELKDMELNEINIKCYKDVLDEFDDKEYHISSSILVLMELSDNGHINKCIDIINTIKKSNRNIYIKYHPREHNFYADHLLDNKVRKIESNLSIENLLVNTQNNIIIGSGNSTAFLILPLISKNTLIMTNKIFNLNVNERYLDIVKKNCCIELDKINDLDKYI